MSIRTEKVASLVKEELGLLFQQIFSITEYGIITITDVHMSADLKIAKVYVSIYGDEARKAKSLSMLESRKSFIRSMLGHAIRLRYTPEITFYLDDSMDRVFRIESIFHKIHKHGSKDETQNHTTDT